MPNWIRKADVVNVVSTEIPGKSLARPSRGATRTKKVRSAMTNGTRPFIEGNPVSRWGRRWRDLQSIYIGDLGGLDRLSEYQRGLVGTLATIQCEIERMQGDLSLDRDIDVKELARLAGTFRRTADALGLQARNDKQSAGGLGAVLRADLDRQRKGSVK